MTVNLLAICRQNNEFILKRVKTTPDVQSLIAGVFVSQEQSFLAGITQEIAFDGGWNPEKNEVLVTGATAEMKQIFAASQGNVTALQDLDSGNFINEGIRALAVFVGSGPQERLLIQNFSARQILDRRIALILSGDTFNRLTEPTFSIGTSVAAVLDGERFRFKSFSNVKMIFDVANLYKEASDIQLDTFSSHASLNIPDAAKFKSIADQTIRKLVHAVSSKGVLDSYSVDEIIAAANAHNLVIDVQNGKIAFPDDRASAKRLMHFFDEGFYVGALSGDQFIANSKRKA